MSGETDFQSFVYARAQIPDDGLPAPYGGVLIQAFVPMQERADFNARLADMPRLPITAPDVLELEMMAAGAYSPLTGFMTREVYESVLDHAALPDGRPWGMPVTLAVSREVALSIRSGQEVVLTRGGEPVGVMQVEEMFPWDAVTETRALGLGSDNVHVAARCARQCAYLVGGPVALLAVRGASFMQPRHLWPREMRGQFVQRGWRQVAAVHLRHPWRRTHEYLMRCALEASDAIVLHTPVDNDVTGSVVPPDLLKSASRMLIESAFPPTRVAENPMPSGLLARNPRAALMHAIVSQNYGIGLICLPAPADNDGTRELFNTAVRHGLEVRPAYIPEAFYCEACGGVSTGKSCPHDDSARVEFTDEQVMEHLQLGESLPSLVTRPAIARSLARGFATRPDASAPVTGRHIYPHASEVSRELRQSLIGHKSGVLWMTGLSGSGKSTIAHRLERDLLLAGHRVFVLDGDTLRHGLNRDLGFSEADRRENLRRAAEVARVMVEAGMIVMASFISPFRAERTMVREILGTAFHEVYVEASLEACEERDPKGLYKRARAGHIPQFTGISSPYEPPESPDVRIDTTRLSIEACVQQLRDYLSGFGLLRGAYAGEPERTIAEAPPPAFRIQ